VISSLTTEAIDQKSLAELLTSSPTLSSVVLEQILKHVSLTLDLLITRMDAAEIVLPSSDLLYRQPISSSEDIKLHINDSDNIIEVCVKYLVFLQHYFWNFPAIDDGTILTTLKQLLSLLGARNDLSSVANQTLSALFLLLKDRTPQDQGIMNGTSSQSPSVHELVLARVQDLSSSSVKPWSRNYLYQTWLRWTVLPAPYGPPQETLSSRRYWMDLQEGLRNGTAEEKKVCLTIFKASLDLLRQNSYDVSTDVFSFDSKASTEYMAAYTKYCTLYETIVIGRYLNQVEESLPEITSLGAATSKVNHVWINALLTAGLSSSHPDSLRKRVSTWYTEQGDAIFRPTPDHLEFFEKCFLPWAGIPQHFTREFRRYERDPKSEYGQQLLNLISKIIINCQDLDSKRLCVRAVLGYLRFKNSGSFPFTDIYMFEGILKGLDGQACLDLIDATDIVKITIRAEFRVGRDLMIVLGMNLLKMCKLESDQSLESIRGFQELKQEYDDITKDSLENVAGNPTQKASALSGVLDVSAFNRKLHETSHACIHDEGLLDGLDLIRNSASSCDNSDEILTAIEAVSHELERQLFPKDAMMKVPPVLFHPKIIDMTLENTDLRDLVSRLRDECWDLIDGRTYLLPIFARELRDGYFRSSDIIQNIPFERYLLDFLKHPHSPRPEYMMERAVADHLQRYVPTRGFMFHYGREPGYAFACMFDILNRIRETDLDMAKRLLDDLLGPLLAQKPPILPVSNWKTTEWFQALVFLVETLVPSWETGERLESIKTFTSLLAIEPLPRFRFIYEWILCRLYVLTPAGHDSLLTSLEAHDEGNPQLYASLIRLSVMMAQLREIPEAFFTRLVLALITYATNPKVVTRHESQWSIPKMWDYAVAYDYQIKENPAFASLNSYIRTLAKYRNPPSDRLLEWLNPMQDNSLTLIFQGRYLNLDPPHIRTVYRDDFQDLWEDDKAQNLTSYSHEARIPLGQSQELNGSHSKIATTQEDTKANSSANASKAPESATAATGPIQTKSLAWQDALFSPTRLSTPLILVASLIDNPHNLGGLSRCAEIFGCEKLVLRDPLVVNNRQFTLVSVSSHLHLPLEQVKPEDLGRYLVERKQEGYTVVGVEQTDSSQVLGNEGTALPEKTVLVMGSEREGIPTEILVDCDICIEVRQMGLTRSLNVQTAASIALFEYARQHAPSSKK
jgi:tRNA guanosine-2'-O-methyltransferase